MMMRRSDRDVAEADVQYAAVAELQWVEFNQRPTQRRAGDPAATADPRTNTSCRVAHRRPRLRREPAPTVGPHRGVSTDQGDVADVALQGAPVASVGRTADNDLPPHRQPASRPSRHHCQV